MQTDFVRPMRSTSALAIIASRLYVAPALWKSRHRRLGLRRAQRWRAAFREAERRMCWRGAA